MDSKSDGENSRCVWWSLRYVKLDKYRFIWLLGTKRVLFPKFIFGGSNGGEMESFVAFNMVKINKGSKVFSCGVIWWNRLEWLIYSSSGFLSELAREFRFCFQFLNGSDLSGSGSGLGSGSGSIVGLGFGFRFGFGFGFWFWFHSPNNLFHANFRIDWYNGNSFIIIINLKIETVAKWPKLWMNFVKMQMLWGNEIHYKTIWLDLFFL